MREPGNRLAFDSIHHMQAVHMERRRAIIGQAFERRSQVILRFKLRHRHVRVQVIAKLAAIGRAFGEPGIDALENVVNRLGIDRSHKYGSRKLIVAAHRR